MTFFFLLKPSLPRVAGWDEGVYGRIEAELKRTREKQRDENSVQIFREAELRTKREEAETATRLAREAAENAARLAQEAKLEAERLAAEAAAKFALEALERAEAERARVELAVTAELKSLAEARALRLEAVRRVEKRYADMKRRQKREDEELMIIMGWV